MCLVWDPSARHSPMSLSQVCIPSAPAKKRLKLKYHCDVYFIAMQRIHAETPRGRSRLPDVRRIRYVCYGFRSPIIRGMHQAYCVCGLFIPAEMIPFFLSDDPLLIERPPGKSEWSCPRGLKGRDIILLNNPSGSDSVWMFLLYHSPPVTLLRKDLDVTLNSWDGVWPMSRPGRCLCQCQGNGDISSSEGFSLLKKKNSNNCAERPRICRYSTHAVKKAEDSL